MANRSALHLLIESKAEELLGEEDITRFLKQCPEVIGMTPLTEAEVVICGEDWIGFVVIAESHLSVHTQGLKVWIDVFSCRQFEIGPVIGLAKEVLKLGSWMQIRPLERAGIEE